MTNGQEREVTIRLRGISEKKYAHIVNALWMQLRAIDCDFSVAPDEQADLSELDKRWDEYSQVSWTGGGRSGTPQAVAAHQIPRTVTVESR
ncbi:hypothetical protein AB0880_16645 [Micromonospora chersina]|uniref:hypothetical protein n=1 Tax=Micromonospora chersina TaxID=47854 RepID=UPI0034523368